MTYDEIQEFFDKVKGKKIIWTGVFGRSKSYFIPESVILSSGDMVGKTYRCSDNSEYQNPWCVSGGFQSIAGGHWEYYDDHTKSKYYETEYVAYEQTKSYGDKTRCSCKMNDIMISGCRCGGV